MIDMTTDASASTTQRLERSDVTHVARLARLALSDAEADKALDELNAIFDMIATMAAVDTSDVRPMSHAIEMSARLRDDVVTESDQRDAHMALAPATAAGLYLVPRIIE